METTSLIQKLYIAYYGRPADPEGLAYWVERLADNGGDLSSITDAFGTSDEFELRFGALDEQRLVDTLYQQILGRPAEAEGLAFYTSMLARGDSSLIDLALDISNGAQGNDVAVIQNRLQVAQQFTEELAERGLSYGADEIQGAIDLLAGVTANTRVDDYLQSNVQAFLSSLPSADGSSSDESEDDTPTGGSGSPQPTEPENPYLLHTNYDALVAGRDNTLNLFLSVDKDAAALEGVRVEFTVSGPDGSTIVLTPTQETSGETIIESGSWGEGQGLVIAPGEFITGEWNLTLDKLGELQIDLALVEIETQTTLLTQQNTLTAAILDVSGDNGPAVAIADNATLEMSVEAYAALGQILQAGSPGSQESIRFTNTGSIAADKVGNNKFVEEYILSDEGNTITLAPLQYEYLPGSYQVIKGGQGDDIIRVGSSGNDILFGGPGFDLFDFSAKADNLAMASNDVNEIGDYSGFLGDTIQVSGFRGGDAFHFLDNDGQFFVELAEFVREPGAALAESLVGDNVTSGEADGLRLSFLPQASQDNVIDLQGASPVEAAFTVDLRGFYMDYDRIHIIQEDEGHEFSVQIGSRPLYAEFNKQNYMRLEEGGYSLLGANEADFIHGSADNNLIFGGGGDDVLVGGGGSNRFWYTDSNVGNDRILDFDVEMDKIDMALSDVEGMSSLTITDVEGNATISGEAFNGSITLIGVAADDLDSSSFLFAEN